MYFTNVGQSDLLRSINFASPSVSIGKIHAPRTILISFNYLQIRSPDRGSRGRITRVNRHRFGEEKRKRRRKRNGGREKTRKRSQATAFNSECGVKGARLRDSEWSIRIPHGKMLHLGLPLNCGHVAPNGSEGGFGKYFKCHGGSTVFGIAPGG